MSLVTYTTPQLLLSSPFSALTWIDDLVDDLFVQPRMEVWPASRLHRTFFNRQMRDIQREMSQLMDWTDNRLHTLSAENANQKLKVIDDNEKEFQLNLACNQFKPEEIKCKVDGNYLTVEGDQEHKDEKTGSVSKRHFVRHVLLPENSEVDQVNCTFKSDGVLAITIPKKQVAIEDAKKPKVIPIKQE